MRIEAIDRFVHSAGDFLRYHLVPRTGKEVLGIKKEFEDVYWSNPHVIGVGIGSERFGLIGKRPNIFAYIDNDLPAVQLAMPKHYKGVPVKYDVF